MLERKLIAFLLSLWPVFLLAAEESAHEAYQRGDFVHALEQWLRVEPTPEINVRLADAYQRLGHYEKAEAALKKAQAMPLSTAQQALVWNAYGSLALARGEDYRAQADKWLSQALKAARRSRSPRLIAQILNQQGNLYFFDLAYERAEQTYDEALALARQEASPSELIAKILLNRLRNHMEWGQYDETRRAGLADAWLAVWQAWQTTPAGYAKVQALIQLGETAEQALPARTAFTAALTLARQLQNPTAHAYAAGTFGAWLAERGENDTALALTRQAVFHAQHDPQGARLYRWYRQLGALLKGRGDMEAAQQAYRKAVEVLRKQWYSEAHQGYRNIRRRFARQVAPVYLEFTELLLQQAVTADENTRQQRLQEALKVLESFKQVELEDYFQTPCRSSQTQRCPLLEHALPANIAVLYPIVYPDHLSLLLKRNETLYVFDQPVSQDILIYEITWLSSLLRTPPARSFLQSPLASPLPACAPTANRAGDTPTTSPFQDLTTLQTSARRLYQWLIEPFASALEAAGVDTLVVVPDGSLRTIPFAALYDGEQYLVQRYALAVSPGLCMTALPGDTGQTPLLLGGLSESVRGFSALACVDYELDTLRHMYPDHSADLLLNADFTNPDLELTWESKPYSAVHLASHGQFNADPKKTFILTYDGKLTLDKLQQLVQQHTHRHAPLELLTLSACETAAGNDRAALGLAGVAIKAGAKSALAGLWRIDDQATPAVIIEFYRQLQQAGRSKAAALQNAQRLLLEDPRYENYRHPYYWAAFLLIGQYR